MKSLNTITLIGRLGRHPEVRTSKSGSPWCKLAVATNRRRKDGDSWKEETDWHQVKVFGAEAERCGQWLRSGSLVSIEGSMSYDRWEDDEGKTRVAAAILANKVGFLGDLREQQQIPA